MILASNLNNYSGIFWYIISERILKSSKKIIKLIIFYNALTIKIFMYVYFMLENEESSSYQL